MRYAIIGTLFSALVAAQNSSTNSGIPPRQAVTDYPVHATIKLGTLGAAILPPENVKKIFSGDIASRYVVVEGALYPEQQLDIDRPNFSLKMDGSVSRAAPPRDAAQSWPERRGPLGGGPQVTGESGVIYERVHDPVNGNRTTVGTWESVGVSNGDPRTSAAGQDPIAAAERKLQDLELPMRPTSKAIAGYLYFPRSAKIRKGAEVEMEYSRDGDAANLRFPKH